MNVLVGVHERVENLLNSIGIRDLVFCDKFFMVFITGLEKLHFPKKAFKKNINFCDKKRLLHI